MAKSRTSIYAALISNTAIGIIKFVAAYFSGSSAMLSEGIHSIVDSCNELLLLFGINRSKRPADIEHPFGHGQDLYFWSLIVSILVFGLGGGMSVYEGISHVRNPIAMDDALWNYVVLGSAFVFEAVSFYIAVRDFLKEPGSKGHFWSNLRKSKDPGFFIVIYESVGDLAGLIIAFGGVILSNYFNNPVIDGIASILIGLVLTVIAILMIIESRNLLIGETADLKLVKQTEELIRTDRDVFEVQRPLTVQLSPDEVFLALNLQFRNELTGGQVVEGINRLETAIRKKFPQIKQIYLEAQNLSKKKRE
jgi:cation diffusion facilitator family transporter